jgi:hypothetical protein
MGSVDGDSEGLRAGEAADPGCTSGCEIGACELDFFFVSERALWILGLHIRRVC